MHGASWFTNEALQLPCAADDHAPFHVRTDATTPQTGIYGWVRTESVHRDGGGGRTDLHDVCSTLWAVTFRALGIASARLLDFTGMCGPPELYARYVIFEQPFMSVAQPDHAKETVRLLKAQTSLFYHYIAEIIRWRSPTECPPSWRDNEPPEWVARARKLLRVQDDYEIWLTRLNPDWQYYTAADNAFSITVLPPHAGVVLRNLFAGYKPVVTELDRAHVFKAQNLFNVVGASLMRKGVKLIQSVEGERAPPWKGPAAGAEDYAILIIPLESHCAFVGRQTMVLLRGACGYNEYLKKRDIWAASQARDAEIFNFSTECAWAAKIDPSRFEALVYSLLLEEPGVEHLRSVGTTRDRDQGRDLIASWLGPAQGVRSSKGSKDSPFVSREIVIQVKTRGRTIGKADVRDVRDTLDRHAAGGFLLVASPQISSDLGDYLRSLRQHGYWVDWWTRQQIEDRLRRRPHIASLFSDVLELRPKNASSYCFP